MREHPASYSVDRERGAGGERGRGQLSVTSKLGLSAGSFKEMEQRGERTRDSTSNAQRTPAQRAVPSFLLHPETASLLFSCIQGVFCAIYVPKDAQGSGVVQHALNTCAHHSPLTACVHCSQTQSGLAGPPHYVTAPNHADASEPSESSAHTGHSWSNIHVRSGRVPCAALALSRANAGLWSDV